MPYLYYTQVCMYVCIYAEHSKRISIFRDKMPKIFKTNLYLGWKPSIRKFKINLKMPIRYVRINYSDNKNLKSTYQS